MKRGFIITALALIEMSLALIFLSGWTLVAAFVLGAGVCCAFPPKVSTSEDVDRSDKDTT